jgi:hypothetical protein
LRIKQDKKRLKIKKLLRRILARYQLMTTIATTATKMRMKSHQRLMRMKSRNLRSKFKKTEITPKATLRRAKK